jgi:hypothetical protein
LAAKNAGTIFAGLLCVATESNTVLFLAVYT